MSLPDGYGGRKDIILGKYGTKESRSEYVRVIGEWEANGRCLPKPGGATDLTINELLVRFWAHAEQHYRHADGTPTNELTDFRLSLKPLRAIYGLTPASKFGPLALKAIRQQMMKQPVTVRVKVLNPKSGKREWQEKVLRHGLARGVINQRIGRIRRVFAWGVENELVPGSVLHALEAVRGLERGRSMARETAPVKPVADALVNTTLPLMRPQVAAMVELQRHTGMRPGEVVLIRGIDLDVSGKVWLYRPSRHKTEHRGFDRIIAIGPKAQEVLRLFRSVADAANVIADFDRKGIELIAIAEGFDMTTPYGRAMAQMASVFAELERAMIQERTTSAMSVKRPRGERISRYAPFGWDFGPDGRLVANAREQKVIDRMRQLRAEGLFYRRIAVRLGDEGILPKRGTRWIHTTVQGILARTGP